MGDFDMKTDEETLQDYIGRLPAQVGDHNASLMKAFMAKYQALPSEPSTKRLILVVLRLKSISIMMNNASLDALTEQDIMNLNTAMRKKGMLSAQDYRKTLRRFLRLTDKKKYYDLLESDYLKAAPKKANERLLVDADTFWSQEEINRYLYQSKEHSPMQATWASLWLGTGCRPHELLNLAKKDVAFDGTYLTVKVQGGKTGKRTIVLNNDSGKGMWNYIQPYWQTLKDEDKLFPLTWDGQNKIHRKICKKSKIGKTKKTNLYIARKMALTRFYNDYKLIKAATLAGHKPGSKVMANYCAMNEASLKEEDSPKVATRTCPNPSCGIENEPHQNYCTKCAAPLDKKLFSNIFEKQIEEMIEAKMNFLKGKVENKALKTLLG